MPSTLPSLNANGWSIHPQNLNALLTHDRTTRLFLTYAPLITLRHMHLVHALGSVLEFYRVASFPAGDCWWSAEGEGVLEGGLVRGGVSDIVKVSYSIQYKEDRTLVSPQLHEHWLEFLLWTCISSTTLYGK